MESFKGYRWPLEREGETPARLMSTIAPAQVAEPAHGTATVGWSLELPVVGPASLRRPLFPTATAAVERCHFRKIGYESDAVAMNLPKCQYSPADLHTRKPYPWGYDLKHQVICGVFIRFQFEYTAAWGLLGIMPTM